MGAKYATGVAKAIADGFTATPILTSAFNFDAPAPPPACDVTPGCKGPICCTDDQLTQWVFASLTYHLWNWFYSPFGPFPNGSYFPVQFVARDKGDINNLKDDVVTFFLDVDSDGDGIKNPDDNCFLVKNPNQADEDGDGIGDLCDVCKGDPDNDIDRDGVCARHPDQSPWDNCPTVKNHDQRNANALSESFHTSQATWGDACSPVPVPDQQSEGVFVLDPNASIDGPIFSQYCGTTFRDQLQVAPLRSSPCDSSHDLCKFKQPNAKPAPVPKLPTRLMFCQKDLSVIPARSCADAFDISDDRLSDSDCAPTLNNSAPCGKIETNQDHFHRTKQTIHTTDNFSVDPNDPPFKLDYTLSPVPDDNQFPNPAPVPWTWQYTADWQRWTTSLNGPPFITNAPKPHSLLGTTWFHAYTDVGQTDQSLGTGIQCKSLACALGLGNNHNQLANHHDADFTPEHHSCNVFSHFAIAAEFFWIIPTLPDPGPNPFQPEILFDKGPAILTRAGADIVALAGSGLAESVAGRIGTQLKTSLGDPSLTWARLSEPFAWQGDAVSPMAVALSADGSQIVDTMTVSAGKLLGVGDRAVTAPARTGSPHADDYTATLSRFRNAVFVAGGNRPSTVEPTGEIWYSPLDATEWIRLGRGLPIERVLAATYLHSTDELVILDRDRAAAGPMRLSAVRVGDDSTRVLGLLQVPGSWDHQWLVVGRHGELIVVMSSTVEQRHAIARLDLEARRTTLLGFEEGRRALAFPPVPSVNGYVISWTPSPAWPDAAIAAQDAIRIGRNSIVSGDVAVMNAATAAVKTCDDDEGECEESGTVGRLVLRRGATVFGTARADVLRVAKGAHLRGPASYNRLANKGAILGELTTPLALPLALPLPPLPPASAGGANVVVLAKQRLTLGPGGVGAVQLKPGSPANPTVLTLTGGSYGFASLTVSKHARIECLASCEIRVAGTLRADENSYLGPAVSAPIGAADVIFFVASADLGEDDPAAWLGANAVVRARIFAPFGSLVLRDDVDATGTFFGRLVRFGEDAKIHKDERGIQITTVRALATEAPPGTVTLASP